VCSRRHGQDRADLGLKGIICNSEQAPDATADEGYGVLGRHGVVERGGVQHALHPDQPRFAGHLLGHPEDAVGVGGVPQACPHAHQHRVDEASLAALDARCVLPAKIAWSTMTTATTDGGIE
jgi:hypothetical protein